MSATAGVPFPRAQEPVGPRGATAAAQGARPASYLESRSCRTKFPRVQNWRQWSDLFPESASKRVDWVSYHNIRYVRTRRIGANEATSRQKQDTPCNHSRLASQPD